MNILISFNSKYFMTALVMAKSLIRSNSGILTIYVFYSEITEKEKLRFLNEIQEVNRVKVIFIEITETYFDKVALNIKYITKETYYRLMAQEKLPREIDRILYLDVDLLVNSPLMEFYNMDFNGNLLLACKDMLILEEIKKMNVSMGVPVDTPYFNAGVLLYNLEQMRKEINVEELYDYALGNSGKFKYGDQDVLNYYFHNRVGFVDAYKYNMSDSLIKTRYELRMVLNQSAIIHFYGWNKPWLWNYIGRMNNMFWKYACSLPEHIPLYISYKWKNVIYRIYYKIKRFIINIAKKVLPKCIQNQLRKMIIKELAHETE